MWGLTCAPTEMGEVVDWVCNLFELEHQKLSLTMRKVMLLVAKFRQRSTQKALGKKAIIYKESVF